MHRLSKSKILSGRQCLRRLWLEKNRADLIEISPATRRVFRTGHHLNEVVHGLYPEGHLVGHDLDLASALKETAFQLEAHPGRPLFEATFSKHNVLIRVDILLPSSEGLHLVEVKSSTSVKSYHLTDCAIQTWVLREAGYRPDRTTLAHIDSSFVYPGDQDYRGIIKLEDVTQEIAPLISEVPLWVKTCQKALSGDEPDISIGKHCNEPFECPFTSYCTPAGSKYPIECLPRIHEGLVEELHAGGFHDIRDIPLGILTNDIHEWVRSVTLSGKADLKPELSGNLRALPYPRYYIDFETIQFAIPIWEGTHPYEQLPFQWSCHVETDDDNIGHHEFLDAGGKAPMRGFAESLIDALGSEGPVIVYSHFERTVLDKLKRRFPDLADSLQAIIDREFDLLKVLHSGYYHPDMKGSWSIKAILPVVAKNLSYDTLEEVKDGMSSQIAFEEAIDQATSLERKAQLTNALLEYCRLDTWAMVELVRLFSYPES